ncbi:MAG: GlsB/YeaQ/YmgE family stress response membrane protein [Candidatus Acidiferrales bacterium]
MSTWLIWTVVIGALAGWLVAFIVKDRRAGLAVDLFVGIAGAILGGLISKYLGLGRHSLLGRLVISLLAAVFFLIVQQVVKRS